MEIKLWRIKPVHASDNPAAESSLFVLFTLTNPVETPRCQIILHLYFDIDIHRYAV